MASVYRQPRSPYWWMRIRDHRGTQRRLSTGIEDLGHLREEALELAGALQDACNCLRRHRHTTWAQIAVAVELLEAHRLLDSEEAAGWRAGDRVERLLAPITDSRAIPIREAALQALSVQRERERYDRGDGTEYRRHLRELDEFLAWSGLEQLRDLTREHVLDWIAHLRQQGTSWDGRRHRLLYIKAAAAMGPRHGLPNPLAGERLDPRDETATAGPAASELAVLTADQLGLILRYLRERSMPRWLVAAGLMVSCGLRPSELLRLRAGDIAFLPREQPKQRRKPRPGELEPEPEHDCIVTVGATRRKTRASYRRLLVPSLVVEWLREAGVDLAGDPTRFLISVRDTKYSRTPALAHPRATRLSNAGLGLDRFGRDLGDQLARALGMEPPAQDRAKKAKKAKKAKASADGAVSSRRRRRSSAHPTPKVFRKTFASISAWDLQLSERLIEYYLGRSVPGLSETTQRHYLSRAQIDHQRPVAEAWDVLLRKLTNANS